MSNCYLYWSLSILCLFSHSSFCPLYWICDHRRNHYAQHWAGKWGVFAVYEKGFCRNHPSGRVWLSPGRRMEISALFHSREARGRIRVGERVMDFDTVSNHVRKLSEHARSLQMKEPLQRCGKNRPVRLNDSKKIYLLVWRRILRWVT